MSLIEDIKNHYEDSSCPPYDGDFEEETELVCEEFLGKHRWGSTKQWVYKRGDAYVAVRDVEPATEMQDWGDYGAPEIYPVVAVPVHSWRYVKVVEEGTVIK